MVNVPRIKVRKAEKLSFRKLIAKMKSGYINYMKKQRGAGGGEINISEGKIVISGDNILKVLGAGGAGGKVTLEGEVRVRKGNFELELPPFQPKMISPLSTEEKEAIRNINIRYPLIPLKPRRGEKIYAYAHIFWNNEHNNLVYNVIEPFISKADIKQLEEIKRKLTS